MKNMWEKVGSQQNLGMQAIPKQGFLHLTELFHTLPSYVLNNKSIIQSVRLNSRCD